MPTDEEQVENLKKWWDENGRSVVAGIIIGVGGLFGYRYWIEYQTQVAEEASAHFIEMVEALESDKTEIATEQANILLSEYDTSEYATMARFTLARNHVVNGEYEPATEYLQQIVGTLGNQALGFLARKRLASVQMQMSDADAALSTLDVVYPEEFSAGFEELKGDIYAMQNNLPEAQSAYQKALGSTPGPADRPFLQQKLDDLGIKG